MTQIEDVHRQCVRLLQELNDLSRQEYSLNYILEIDARRITRDSDGLVRNVFMISLTRRIEVQASVMGPLSPVPDNTR